MLRLLSVITFIAFSLNLLTGQECPIINTNGTFEELIYVPGGEPSIGITTGQIENWYASHGTVDYVTSDWNWYDLPGVTSVAGHMCYGNRDSHDHSEGMFTNASIYGDDDLLYTLALDYGTVCDADNNGFLSIALNNHLSSEGHNWFQYPTPESLPEYFEEIQAVDRFELKPEANFEQSGMSTYEVSFVPQANFDQLWLFTEYQYPEADFVNCGIMIDNVKLTATTSALTGIKVMPLTNNNYNLTPEFSKELDIVSYNWTVDHEVAGATEELVHAFENDIYTICLDIVDTRGACGSACYELDLNTATEESSTDVNACTYSTCLDLSGIPNIERLDFMNNNGQVVTIDANTEGFYFPYCIGTSSMCAGGVYELDLFVNDLNNYFDQEGLNTKASMGYSAEASDLECRATGLTIKSSDLVPVSIITDNYATAELLTTEISFDFNPNNCSSDVDTDPGEELDLVINESPTGEYAQEEDSIVPTKESINPIVSGNSLIIEEEEDLVTEGGIYTLNGQLVLTVDAYEHESEIDLNSLTTGMYVIRLINKKHQKTGFFFKGE